MTYCNTLDACHLWDSSCINVKWYHSYIKFTFISGNYFLWMLLCMLIYSGIVIYISDLWFSRHFSLKNELSESDDPVYLQNSKYTFKKEICFLNNYLHFFSVFISNKVNVNRYNSHKTKAKWDFAGSPVVKTLMLPPLAGAWVLSLVEEPRSYMPFGKTKKKRQRTQKFVRVQWSPETKSLSTALLEQLLLILLNFSNMS